MKLNPLALWQSLTLTPAKLDEAESGIKSKTALIGIKSPHPKLKEDGTLSGPEEIPQVQCFETNKMAIFQAYHTIAAVDPRRAIKALLELEKPLKHDAQFYFWLAANEEIRKSLKDTTPATKIAVYQHIFANAHKGQLGPFLLSHADNLAALLVSDDIPTNVDFVGSFLSHATPPHTSGILEQFRPELESLYREEPTQRLSLTKKILKACQPINGKDKNTPLPDYVAKMRAEQIDTLITRATYLYSIGADNGFKKITNCLQELETLKASSSSGLTRIKGEKPTKIARSEKEDFYYYLYKLPIQGVSPRDGKQPSEHLYVLARRPKGYGSPEGSGILTTVLATTDVTMISKSFQTLPYDRAFHAVVAEMASHFPLPLKQDYRISSHDYKTAHVIPAAPLVPSFKLTGRTDSLNLGNEQASATTINWDIHALQLNPDRQVQ